MPDAEIACKLTIDDFIVRSKFRQARGLDTRQIEVFRVNGAALTSVAEAKISPNCQGATFSNDGPAQSLRRAAVSLGRNAHHHRVEMVERRGAGDERQDR